jgi:hypothetical protein
MPDVIIRVFTHVVASEELYGFTSSEYRTSTVSEPVYYRNTNNLGIFNRKFHIEFWVPPNCSNVFPLTLILN